MIELQELQSAVDDASRAYARASEALETILASGDPAAERTVAEAAMREAGDALNRAQHALITAAHGPTFEDLLADPTEQFDLRSEVLASIMRYQRAASATAASSSPWLPSHSTVVFGSPASIIPSHDDWVPADRTDGGRRRRAG